MKFEVNLPGRKKLIIFGVIISLVIIGIIVFVLRSRSKYSYPPVSTDSTYGQPLQDAILVCTTKYRQAIQDGLSDSTPPKSSCIQTAVNAYFTGKCPDIVNGRAPAAGTPASTYYTTYTSQSSTAGSLASVSASSEYTGLQITPGISGVTTDMVVKARKADMTGPTRRYIASACDGFYIPADLPSNTEPFTTTYKGWTKFNNAPGSAPTSYGFYSPYVTGTSVYEWAIKAGVPLTIAQAQAADGAGVNTTTKSIVVSSAPSLVANDVIKISGVSTVGPLTVSSVSSTNITLSYSSQSIPSIPAGAFVSKSTASSITSSQSTTLATPVNVGEPITPTSATSWILNLGKALDTSIQVGSQVLISGTTLTGAVTVQSIINVGRTQVQIGFGPQPFPTLPLGVTIENVFDIPLATPLVATPPVCIVGSATAATAAATLTLGSVSVSTGTNTTKYFAITAPATAIAAGTVVKIMTPTYPLTTAATPAAYTYTTTASIASTATGGTGLHVIGLTGNWPAATIPVGTILFNNATNTVITGASSPTYTIYNKMGSLNGTNMLNWQIAQLMGPGSVMPNYNGVAQPVWGTA